MPSPKVIKADLVRSIFAKTGITPRDAQELIDALLDAIKAGLLEDRVVELRGLGTFEVRRRQGRQTARTGVTVAGVGPNGVTVFKPGREPQDDPGKTTGDFAWREISGPRPVGARPYKPSASFVFGVWGSTGKEKRH